MKYSTSAAFRAALEDRLRQEAAESGVQVGRLRKAVVFDRLLARLAAGGTGWVVKGGFALELRLGTRARTTRDLDLDRSGSVEAATTALQVASRVDLGDFFEFQIERSGQADVGGVRGTRFRATAYLAGRVFDVVLVDVGFSDPLPTTVDRLEGPRLLTFAEIAPASVPAVPLEQHLAEKVHAYTRRYGRDEASSRTKDLIDLALIARIAGFRASRLRTQLKRTFETRAMHELPETLPAPPPDWSLEYARLAGEVDLARSLEEGFRTAATLVDHVLRDDPDGTWDPVSLEWDTS